jgi:hypothetical protein
LRKVKKYYYFCTAILNVFEMMELIIKNDIGKKKMEDLLLFLKSRNIEAEIKPATKIHKTKKVRVINKSHVLSDEQLAEKLSGEVSDMSSCLDGDYREIVTNHRPVFQNGLEKWL